MAYIVEANNFFFGASSIEDTVVFLLEFGRKKPTPSPLTLLEQTSMISTTSTSLVLPHCDLYLKDEQTFLAVATATSCCPIDRTIVSPPWFS